MIEPAKDQMGLFDDSVTSSPNPLRSSACFGALALATTMDMFAEGEEGETKAAIVSSTETVDFPLSSMMLDEMIAERTAFEIEKIAAEMEQVKRSVGGSPKATSNVPALTPSKSRKALKHLRQQSIKAVKAALVTPSASDKSKVHFEGQEANAGKQAAGQEAPTAGAAASSAACKTVKGSPSRLVRSRLVNKPTAQSRVPVSVPPSNVQPSQLKAADAFMMVSSPNDDPLGAKSQSAASTTSSAAVGGGRSRSATLDETASGVFFNGFGTAGGMVAGRMYDVYGFEESPLRASVVPSSVLVANPAQMSFWTEWLASFAAPAKFGLAMQEGEADRSDVALGASDEVDPSAAVQTKPVNGVSAVLASMAFSGVPQVLRGRVWANFVNVSQYRLDHSPVRGYYGELRNRGRHEKWGHQIDLDLPRTFCGHVYFRKEARGQKQLSNVLNAYSHYNEKVGYCQGMSFLVGMLLMVMEEEEKVFWTFCAIMDRDEGRLASYYEPGMMGVLEDVNLFRKMILLEMPALYAHFEKVGVDASFFVTRWLLSLFTDLSDWSTVLRFWDLYMLHGHLALFRACLTILKANLSDLLSMKNCELLFPFLLNLPFSKLNPSVIISIYRTIDIQYLFDEVTAPDSDVKYAVAHIHQPLPHHSKRKNTEKSLQRGLSKKQLAKLAKKQTQSDLAAQKASSSSSAAAQLPTTPLPRKSRPQSMMVFGSSSDHASSQHAHEHHGSSGKSSDEISTPSGKSKSFFGRMWDKLKSPAVAVISGSGTKKSQSEKEKLTPGPNTHHHQQQQQGSNASASSASRHPSTPSVHRASSEGSASGASPSSPSRRKLQFSRSPSRKSKKSLHGHSAVVVDAVAGASSLSIASSDGALASSDAYLKKRSSPKRKRDDIHTATTAAADQKAQKGVAFDESASRPSASSDSLSKQVKFPAQKKRVIAWVAEDVGENATKWDGGDDLFMDKSERDAFIEFATATPIRAGARTGVYSTTPRPAPAAGSLSKAPVSSTDAPSFTLPPPPRDFKVAKDHVGANVSAPKVIGAPMQLAPAFYQDSAQTPSRTPTTSKRKQIGHVTMSPIEMDSSWIPTKP
jgi:hypothetical protein